MKKAITFFLLLIPVVLGAQQPGYDDQGNATFPNYISAQGVTATTVNGVIDATPLYPKYTTGGFHDLGAAINMAISMLPASAVSPHAGLVTIGPGIFYDSTTVIRPQQVTIQGSGNGTLIVFLPHTGLFAIDGDGISPSPGTGGWRDLRLQGPGNTHTADAFFLGGDPANVISTSTNIAWFSHYDNVEIGYFRDAMRIGNNVWNIGCTECHIHDNISGPDIETGATNVGEVLGFYNSVINNNTSYALYSPAGQFPYYGWTSVGSAFDYNGNGTQAPIVGSIRSTSSHYEQNKGPIWDETSGGQVIDSGSSIVLAQASPCLATFNASSGVSTFNGTIGLAFAALTAWNCTSTTNYYARGFNNSSPRFFPYPLGEMLTIFSAAGTPIPSCISGLKGSKAVVSDATSPTYLATYTSGGAVAAQVVCNGSNWVNY